jgi:hypothetical protein
VRRAERGSGGNLRNASLRVRDLGGEQAGRFGRGLNYLLNDWVERFGPVKDGEVRVPQYTVEQTTLDARLRCDRDIGAAYALEFLCCHVEASYSPGEDAAFVYDLTSYYISQAGNGANVRFCLACESQYNRAQVVRETCVSRTLFFLNLEVPKPRG